jgi:hypothetical protein
MIDLDPEQYGTHPITCWGMPTAEEMEAGNRRIRETVALWMFNDNFEENGFLHSEKWAETKKEFMKTNPYFE